MWNASYSQGGSSVKASNESYNANIPAGGESKPLDLIFHSAEQIHPRKALQ